MGLNGWELGIILVLVLIVFGAGKLPDVFRQAGKGIKAFKDASEGKGGVAEEDEGETDEERAERLRKRKAERKELAAKDDLDDDPEEVKSASSKKEAK